MIYFVGESHTWFLSKDPEAIAMKAYAGDDPDKWTPVHTRGTHTNENGTFIWETGQSMFKSDEQFLQSILSPFDIKPEDTVLFAFGAVDCGENLPKYQNTPEVVKSYMNRCKNSVNAQVRFIGPTYNGPNEKEYNEFIDTLNYHSRMMGIKPPIIFLGKAVPREFISDDIWSHMSWDDCNKAITYIMNELKSK